MLIFVICIFASIAVPAAYFGFSIGKPDPVLLAHSEKNSPYALSSAVFEERKKLAETRVYVDESLANLSARVGVLQAQITRINAVEKRLAKAAKVDISAFDFSSEPALGGGEADANIEIKEGALDQQIKSMDEVLSEREAAIQALGVSLSEMLLKQEQTPDGMPVRNSWISSPYGWRNNPISGRKQFHKGVDLPGKMNANIIAVADGIVVKSRNLGLLGNMVEINHGDGLKTIYAHNSENLVTVGDSVKKGDVIAKVGSTGRSTGPHVHFEVRKHGKPINPYKFLK